MGPAEPANRIKLRTRIQYALRYWFARHGIKGLARWIGRDVVYYAWPYGTHSGWLERHFDSVFGVDTRYEIPESHAKFKLSNPGLAAGVGYGVTRPRAFRQVLRTLRVDYGQFAFVDVGCGKGRTLLLASECPFSRIIGIDFAPELVTIPQRNVASYRDAKQACRETQVLCMGRGRVSVPRGQSCHLSR